MQDNEGSHQMYSNVFYDTVPEVRSVLQIASLGVHGREKWMTISGMGYLIASIYSVLLVSLSRNLNIAFFSLVIASCIASSTHKIIAADFVDNSH